jgi:hypothetical protein
MGREYELGWDAEAGELLVTPLSTGGEPWRFAPEGADRWRGTAGMNDGELLLVRREPGGEVRALEIATFVFTRDPARLD